MVAERSEFLHEQEDHNKGLDEYYPIVFVDCVHIMVFRKKKAANKAFYVVLGVNEDGTRDVLGKTAMDKESYTRVIPRIREDKTLFPNE